MPSILIEFASLDFMFAFPDSAPIAGLVPADLVGKANEACDALFFPSAFDQCRSGRHIRSAPSTEEAVDLAFQFAAAELANGRTSGAVPMPEIEPPPVGPGQGSLVWRPIGPIHQVIGKVLKSEGGAASWWSVSVSSGGISATAYLCCSMSFRELET